MSTWFELGILVRSQYREYICQGYIAWVFRTGLNSLSTTTVRVTKCQGGCTRTVTWRVVYSRTRSRQSENNKVYYKNNK